jgi:Leucine rich repeat
VSEVRITRMSESLSTAEKIEPVPAKGRLHRSTLVVAGLVLLLGVILNCGGDLDNYDLKYGFPFVFGRSDTDFNYNDPNSSITTLDWFRVDRITIFYANSSLLIDVVIVLFAMAIIAGLWEYRRRKVKRVWQFTTWDWLGICLLLGLAFQWYEWLYRELRAEKNLRQLAAIEDNLPQTDLNADIPCDWFWECFNIPLEQRPVRKSHLQLDFSIDPPEFLEEKRSEITHNERLEKILSCVTQYPKLEWCQIDIYAYDSGFQKVSPESFAPLFKVPKRVALELQLVGDELSTELLSTLGSIPSLDSFSVSNADSFHGQGLSALTNISRLSLSGIGLNDAGMREVGQLSLLNVLKTSDFSEITGLGWQSLASLPALDVSHGEATTDNLKDIITQLPKLKSLAIRSNEITANDWKLLAHLSNVTDLEIHSETFTDDSLKALERLSKLEYLSLSQTGITPAAIASFKKMRALNRLMIIPKINIGGNFGFSAIPIDPAKGITPELEKEIVESMTFHFP